VLPKYSDGQHRVLCPQCEGGRDHEKSLSVGVQDNGKSATWLCFRATCGWTGSALHLTLTISASPEPKPNRML
jgi:twinkle protein